MGQCLARESGYDFNTVGVDVRGVKCRPYFGTYELVCRAGLGDGEEAGAGRKLVAGGLAGVVGWGST